MTEKAIAAKLEVSRNILRTMRKGMRRPWDWRKDGTEIVFTERGLKLLGEKFGIKREDLNGTERSNGDTLPRLVDDRNDSAAADTGTRTGSNISDNGKAQEPATPVQPLVRRMTVTRVYDNVKMLLAKDENEKRWEVIVGNNAHFMIGMKFNAEPAPANPGYLRLIGKTPRVRGKWMPLELKEQAAELAKRQ